MIFKFVILMWLYICAFSAVMTILNPYLGSEKFNYITGAGLLVFVGREVWRMFS